MILFVDDEKWVIQGHLDRFGYLALKDQRYLCEHCFTPEKALQSLWRAEGRVELIIVDIKMDYGDGNVNTGVSGGIQFLRTLAQKGILGKTSVLVYSMVSRDSLLRDFPEFEGYDKTTYLNRDSEDKEFYDAVQTALGD